MPYRDLRAAEMVGLSSPWSELDHADRAALMADPVIAAYIEHHGDNVHADMVTLQTDTVADRLREIMIELSRLDDRGDPLWRVIVAVLGARVHASRTADEAAEWQAVYDKVAPQGLTVVNLSYSAVAGYGEMLAGRLDDEVRAKLAAIAFADGTLLDSVEEWIAIAREIGVLEHERGRFPNRRSLVPRLRNRWIRMIQGLRMLVDVREVESDEIDMIFARVDRLVRRAEVRRLRGGVPIEDDPALDPDAEPVGDDGEPVGDGADSGELPDIEPIDSAPAPGDGSDVEPSPAEPAPVPGDPAVPVAAVLAQQADDDETERLVRPGA